MESPYIAGGRLVWDKPILVQCFTNEAALERHAGPITDFLLTMGLVLLLVFLNRKARRTGVLFWTYAVWYGTGRIITDFLRVENRFLGLTGSQWTSTIVVAFGVFTLVRFALRSAAAEQSEPAGPGPPAAA